MFSLSGAGLYTHDLGRMGHMSFCSLLRFSDTYIQGRSKLYTKSSNWRQKPFERPALKT